jgi:hypothetical protein
MRNGGCLNCGKEAKKLYCSKRCREAYYRRVILPGGLESRVCETCGEEFIPKRPREVDCEVCREWLKEAEEEEKRRKMVVRRCLRCGVEVVGGYYFCRKCREANRDVMEFMGLRLGRRVGM